MARWTRCKIRQIKVVKFIVALYGGGWNSISIVLSSMLTLRISRNSVSEIYSEHIEISRKKYMNEYIYEGGAV